MMIPCIVKNLLYVFDSTRSPAGVASSNRMSTAKIPPSMKKNVTPSR